MSCALEIAKDASDSTIAIVKSAGSMISTTRYLKVVMINTTVHVDSAVKSKQLVAALEQLAETSEELALMREKYADGSPDVP